MPIYNANDMVKLAREALDFSQEELSRDVCSVQTLSRIENGKTGVKMSTYMGLMDKLGKSTQKNHVILCVEQVQTQEYRKVMEEAMMRLDYGQAEKYLLRLREVETENVADQQYLQRIEALIKFKKKEITQVQLLEKLREALRMTVPDYEELLEKDYPFTIQELSIIMNIANNLQADEDNKSIHIYERLLHIVSLGYMDGNSIKRMLPVLLRQINLHMEPDNVNNKAKRFWEESCLLAAKADYGVLLCFCLINISQLEWSTDRKEQAIQHLKKAYYLAMSQKNSSMMDKIKSYAEIKHMDLIPE